MEIQDKVMLKEKELKDIQTLNANYTKCKLALADAELHKAQIIEDINKIKSIFQTTEQKLINKYGADSVINLQTVEVTPKQDG